MDASSLFIQANLSVQIPDQLGLYDNLQANQTMCQKTEMGLEDGSVVNSKEPSAPSNHATTPNNHL